MRSQAAPPQDLAVGLMPCSPPVEAARVTGALTLQVEFADGLSGEVRFMESHLTGVFEVLRDPVFFAQVGVAGGAVTWPGELDLAPDAMYEAIRQSGAWVLQ